MPNRRLRLGMVGGGRGAFIGAVHALAARMDNRFELVAGCLSSDPARARASAQDWFIAPDRTYDDFQTMAQAEAARADGIDAVAIVTPNDTHHAICRAFLDRKIDIVCDKPLTTTLDDALDLVAQVRRTGLVFVLTHTYSGFPMVRQARAMVAAGELGAIRLVHVEFLQDWLAAPLEDQGDKQALWRTDPQRAGPGGCIADIGTHALHLARYVTGLEVEAVAAQLRSFLPGRRLDDNAQLLMRLTGGAEGTLLASQVAHGNECGLRLRVYGERGGLAWDQERPNHLCWAPAGCAAQTLSRGDASLSAAARRATRLPRGLTEGYLEAFGNIYADAAGAILSRRQGGRPDLEDIGLPGVVDGAIGIAFVEAALRSQQDRGAWVEISLAAGRI
nr:Gfo/Idh/MocA family oxidoreductase [Labrys wisconsinensis]